MDKILEKWDEILSTVKHEHDISDISFDTWIRPLEVYGVEGSTLYILVPSEQMTLSYISKKYYLPLKVTIAELTGTEYEIKLLNLRVKHTILSIFMEDRDLEKLTLCIPSVILY